VEFAPSNTSLYSPASASVAIEVTPSTTAISPIFSYSIVNASGGTGYDANGNILSYTDSVTGAWSNLAYDGVNRLMTGTQAPAPVNGVAQNPQSFCWSYDSFGNRTTQAQATGAQSFTNAGGAAGCQLLSGTLIANVWAHYTVDGTSETADNGMNRLTGVSAGFYQYDGAGNVSYDTGNHYLYDAEGQVCAMGAGTGPLTAGTAVTQYIYDAEGARVAKGAAHTVLQSGVYVLSCDTTVNGFTPTNSYVLGLSGEQLTETDGSGNWKHTNVYAAGALIATYDNATNNTVFALSDWLGTKRVEVGANGCATAYTSLAFGDDLTPGPVPGFAPCADDATEHHFTGKERDTESGNDYFGARYYASSMGRFMSPDWSAKVEPVPYSKLGDPQSLNLYSYVGNNPLTQVDADGHDGINHEFDILSRTGSTDPATNSFTSTAAAAAYAMDNGGFGPDAVQDWLAQQQSDSSSSSDQSHFVSISNYPKGAGGFAHTGIAVDSDDTHGFSTADPDTPWWKRMFGAPAARMEDDLKMHTKNGEVAPHHYIHIPISAEQAQKIQAAIDARAANPGHYNLFFNNCAQEVGSALHAGGVGGVPHGEVFIPAIFDAAVWYTNTWR